MHELFAPLDPKHGAEIGVWNGKTSRSLLKRFPELSLVMVDRWCPPPPGDSWLESGDRFARRSTEEFYNAYRSAMHVTRAYMKRRRVLFRESTDAARLIEDESLDFVFIDGDHSFDGTLADIEAWWPKVKVGGIVSGHDYGEGHDLGYGVAKAVETFFCPSEDGFIQDFGVLTETFIWHATKQ